MHVEQIPRAGPVVQVVHILRDQEQVAAPFPLQAGQGEVGGIGLHQGEAAPPFVVETVDQRRVPVEGLRRGHVLHPVLLPEAVGGAKGAQPAFGGDAGAGEDHETGGSRHGRS